ncbi:MAG TPA: hypothetical protein VJ798_09575 [Rhizomicrobium sp.]|nr:hypothetical protein [Rhizomicrobium sp.]
MKSKSILAGVVAASLLVSSAFAAEKAGPLPAGKPAGTKEAAFLGPNAPIILAVAVAVFVAVAASGGFNDDSTTGTGA